MPIRLVVDGAFATAGLAWTALKLNISLISRLRLDARIFDFPEVRSGPGRPAKRGRRLLAPKTLLQRVDTPWQATEVQWYRGRKKKVQYVTTTCLWRERYFEQVVENGDLIEILTRDGLMAEIIDHLAEAV